VRIKVEKKKRKTVKSIGVNSWPPTLTATELIDPPIAAERKMDKSPNHMKLF